MRSTPSANWKRSCNASSTRIDALRSNSSWQIFFSGLLFFFLLPALFSCSKKPAGAIVGKWHEAGQEDVIEFQKDGAAIEYHLTHAGPPENPVVFTNLTSGKYRFTDG